MPHFSFGEDRLNLPPLSLACLSAYCKQHGIDVAVTDFGLFGQFPQLLSTHQHHCFEGKSLVSEIPDLPLILALVKNFRESKPLLDGFDEVLLRYVPSGLLNFFRVKEGLIKALATIDQHIEPISREKIVGFTTVVSNLFFTAMMALRLRQKNPDLKIVMGGPQVDLSLHTAKLALKLALADCIVLGEGEATIVKVIEAYDAGKTPEVDGTITWEKQSDVFSLRPAGEPLDLNTLPDPDFSVFQLGRYTQLCLPLYGSRGCMYNCTYCTYGKGRCYRKKEPRQVVDTMVRLHEKYNTFRFYFIDSTLNGDTEWLEQFADELIKRKTRFQWWGFFRPWMSRLLLAHLKKAGLFSLTLGAESFSDTVLQRMGKTNITREKIFQTIDLLCREGIPVTAGLIAGFPGETRNDFYYTWRQIVRLQEQFPKLFTINPQMFQVRAGSSCYANSEEFGISLEPWYHESTPPLADVAELVKQVPNQFWVKKPHTNEAWDRFLLYNNIKKPSEAFLFDADKELLIKTLDHIEPPARIRIDLVEYNLHTVKSPTEKRIDILEVGTVKILLSERERYIFQFLNGFTTLADIAAKLSQEYNEKADVALKSIIHFLYYLLDNDVPFDVRY